MAYSSKKNGYNNWSAVLKRITAMTPAEIVEEFGDKVAEKLAQYTLVNKTIKELMVLRAIDDFMTKPSASIWNLMADREEGKLPDKVDGTMNVNISWQEMAQKLGITESEALAEAEKIINEQYHRDGE